MAKLEIAFKATIWFYVMLLASHLRSTRLLRRIKNKTVFKSGKVNIKVREVVAV